jgi:ribosomal protein L35AE/L33A
MKGALAVAASLGVAAVATSVAIATHESGHSSASGFGLQQVKIVRHSFPVSNYAGGQWTTTTLNWVDVPGARTTIRVPPGQKGLIVVRFSPAVICQGTGACETRILIGGVEAQPKKPLSFVGPNTWGVMYTERSRGPLGPGRYVVRGQVQTTFGSSGTTLYVRSYHLTVERIRAG